MLNYEYIFFDLDGTISDSAPGIIGSVLYALDKMGVSEKHEESLTKFVGPPLTESFTKYYGFQGEALDMAVKTFREYYREKGIFENSMYEGIPETLKKLLEGGRRLAVATSKPEPFARIIIDRYGISDCFEFIAGSTIDETRTKKDEVISYALETLGIGDPKTVLMVGDRSHDVLGAKKHGLDCLGVLYGYGSRAELEDAGALYIAETVAGISSIIMN